MNRQDLRSAYPFHNPRANVACCTRRQPAPRPVNWARIVRVMLVLAVLAVVIKECI